MMNMMKKNFPQHPGIGNQTHFRFHSFYFVEKITARNFLFVSEKCRQRNKQKMNWKTMTMMMMIRSIN